MRLWGLIVFFIIFLFVEFFIHELGHYLMFKKLFPNSRASIKVFKPTRINNLLRLAWCELDFPQGTMAGQVRMVYYAGFYLTSIAYLTLTIIFLLFGKVDFALLFLIILLGHLIVEWNVLFGWLDDDAKGVFNN